MFKYKSAERFDAFAESMTEGEIVAILTKAMTINPSSSKIWSRWAGENVSLEDTGSIERSIRDFPCYRLKPIPK